MGLTDSSTPFPLRLSPQGHFGRNDKNGETLICFIMIKLQKSFLFLSLFIFCLAGFLVTDNFILASEVDHIVISEVQVSGEIANDEFIELYNLTSLEIDLKDWDIKKKTNNGTECNILNNIEGVIPAGGYFLIVPRANCGDNKDEDCYKGSVEADDEYTTNNFLAKDNTVLLYDNEGKIIDKVRWGEAADFESEVLDNPQDNQSLERKITDGKIQDTDNNKNDFEIQVSPNPQNSKVVNEMGDSADTNNNEGEDDETGEDENNNENIGEVENEEDDQENQNDSQDEQGNNENQENNTEASVGSGGGGSSGSYDYDIVITELVPNPEDSDAENEFVEIYNEGDKTADISGWTLEDTLGKTAQFVFPENTSISPKKYLVFYRPQTKITLNNSGDGAVLKNSSGKIISETGESGAAMEDWSWSRNEDSEWDWSLTPTPGTENKIDQDDEVDEEDEEDKNNLENEENKKENFDYSDEIIISEIFPNPEGRDNQDENYEWIELYNFSDKKINLYGWQIDDLADGGSKPYFIEDDLEIFSCAYLVLDYSQTKIVLNNNGDTVVLLNPDGKIISQVVYKKDGEEGWSYARDENNLLKAEWSWSEEPTPGEKNILENEEEDEENKDKEDNDEEKINEKNFGKSKNNPLNISITEAKKLPRYSWVKIQGTVSAPSGVFSDKIIYLSGSGIQVYSHQENLPDLGVGDVVEVIGRMSEIGGEKRILLSQADDLKIIGRQEEEQEPLIVSTADVGEPIEGYLVSVEGRVTDTSGNVFYLDDGSGEVKIYIKSSTGIKKPKIKKGDWMTVTGQVSRASSGYRILPRFQSDVRLGRVSGISSVLAESGNSLMAIILILIGVLIFGDWGKMRLRNKIIF